jgi:hypothetical protein
MRTESVTDPGVVERAAVERTAPEPGDCLPPCESPLATADLSPGWVAVTDRELLVYHPDRNPRVGRSLRANVTGLAVRRAGGRSLLGWVPPALLYGLGGVVCGLLLLAVEPTQFVTVPPDSPVEAISTVLRTLGWATDLLGAVLVFAGILAGLGALAVTAYWLLSDEVTFVVELGEHDRLECPTTLPAGRRAIGSLGEVVE